MAMRNGGSSHGLWLLIDADDTLWENSIYFERAIAEFVRFLDHSELTAAEVREVLDEIELQSIPRQGYGSLRFGHNLQQCFRRLAQRHYGDGDLTRVMALAEAILRHPIQLLEGVEETLCYLAGRHHLTLFSKGCQEEQLAKLERSGLKPLFHGCRIVPEKDAGAYRAALAEHEMDPGRTWMVGNSPRSDIHPALEAGLGAVFIPHANTWALEHAELPAPSERFRIVERFDDLQTLF